MRQRGTWTLDTIEIFELTLASERRILMSKMSQPCSTMLTCPFHTDIHSGSVTTNRSDSEAQKTSLNDKMVTEAVLCVKHKIYFFVNSMSFNVAFICLRHFLTLCLLYCLSAS